MKRWAIAIAFGFIAGIAMALWVRHRHGSSERTEAVVLRNAFERDGLRTDVYLPAPGKPAPWIVFAEDQARPDVAEAMQRRGIAVALVSFAIPKASAASVSEGVADIVREMGRRTTEYGLVGHPILVGNGPGASLVAQIALDTHFDLQPPAIGGVVTMNGGFDSCLHLVRADAPPFLILSAHGDSAEHAEGARLFERALDHAGAKSVRRYHISARDERALCDLSGERNDIADLVTSFVRAEPPPGGTESTWAVNDVWRLHAPIATGTFWDDAHFIVRHAVDDHFRAQLGRIFVDTMSDLDPWPRRTYDFIDLADYLGEHPQLGTGEWVTMTNLRGEQLVFSKGEIRKQRPVIVVGIDDERDLFRLLVTYNVYRSYTFRPETEPRHLLARPVGNFLLFPSADGAAPVVTFANFALTPDSFRVVNTDPLAKARALPKPLVQTLTAEQGCLQCHSLRGSGARAHHLRAVDGASTGGEALALEEYPRDVLRRFLFEQDAVARIFGVAPIRVDKVAATQLLDEVLR